MRKSKEIKRKRAHAGLEYKKGNKSDAYKMWAEAKKELDDLRGRAKPAAGAAGAATPAPAEGS
jgi:hypothetical protein